jgi:hypothetical protein
MKENDSLKIIKTDDENRIGVALESVKLPQTVFLE